MQHTGWFPCGRRSATQRVTSTADFPHRAKPKWYTCLYPKRQRGIGKHTGPATALGKTRLVAPDARSCHIGRSPGPDAFGSLICVQDVAQNRRVVPGQEVTIKDVVRRGDQGPDIDRAILAEEDAIRVDGCGSPIKPELRTDEHTADVVWVEATRYL